MNIFTYGSLMFPPVWEKVTGRPALGRPARLADFSARRIRGQSYPALVPQPGSTVDGVLYQNVDDEAVERLDDFEGGFYRRIEVVVSLTTDPAQLACVYVAAHAEDPDILPEEWSAREFEQKCLQHFLTHDPGFTPDGR